ncbi:MAG: 2-oxoacid:acceptor oxidoreductase subunit alpha [Myxococcota bacterium]
MTDAPLDNVVIRFAGDSGDGMQLLGTRFTHTAALDGNDHVTLPDFPAEIRAPAGTRGGVSGFQLQLANRDIFTPGDDCDVLVAMNPAALIKNLADVHRGGLVVVNTDRFEATDLKKAELETNPLADGSLEPFQVMGVPISTLTAGAVEPFGLNRKQSDRCKNFFALGMMYWLYSKSMDDTRKYVTGKFKAPYREANLAAMEAGWSYADTAELQVAPRTIAAVQDVPDGLYRTVTGNQALATGLVVAAQRAGHPLFYGSYPITPASDILHGLARFKNYGVTTFQAEDEIAAVCAAIGASYGGSVGVTGTSGPGLALKAEGIGLAVMAELPLVVVNVQRGGPSTGLPTKTEQSDLLQALYGRNGESPMVILAPRGPADCFRTAYEAVRIALTYMTPVTILSDGYIANGAEPWRVPEPDTLPVIDADHAVAREGETFLPYSRDEATLARPWAVPGTPGLEHRIGGLEKQHLTGNVSYDPLNHESMTRLRVEKIDRIAQGLHPTRVHGDDTGVLIIGWGSTFGAIREATNRCRESGLQVAHVQLRNLNPFPPDLGEVLARYHTVLIPELNLGQLHKLIALKFKVHAQALHKVQGQPFKIREIEASIRALSHTEVS